MKIYLVNPPLTRQEAAGKMQGIVNLLPPLGIGYIAALLEQKGFSVRVVDCPPLGLSQEHLREILAKEEPQIVGFTATTISIESAVEAARNARAVLSNSLTVIGGPHVTALPEETMEAGVFDAAVLGEGEHSFLELAGRVRDGSRDFSGIRGLMYRCDGKSVFNGARGYIEDLDTLPFPAFHLFPPLALYHPMPGNVKKVPYTQIMSSRGCPYPCTFCDRKVFGQRFRARSPKNVVDEIQMLRERFGVQEVKFNDDTFNVDPRRVIGICEEMLLRNIRMPWTCRVDATRLSPDLLKTMKRAGCWQVGFGIESADPAILKTLKRPLPPEEGRRTVQMAKQQGLQVKVSFMLGLPGETAASLRKTVDFAKTLPADIVNFHIFTPFPGTELFQILNAQGLIRHRHYPHYCQLNLPEDRHLPFIPQGLTEEQIRRFSSQAHRSFYLRPSYLYSQLKQIRSFMDIVRYGQAFLAVMGL